MTREELQQYTEALRTIAELGSRVAELAQKAIAVREVVMLGEEGTAEIAPTNDDARWLAAGDDTEPTVPKAQRYKRVGKTAVFMPALCANCGLAGHASYECPTRERETPGETVTDEKGEVIARGE